MADSVIDVLKHKGDGSKRKSSRKKLAKTLSIKKKKGTGKKKSKRASSRKTGK
jgi:hypothetical protein